MRSSILEGLFAKSWGTLDFSEWNEADVREDFVAPLLRFLGYAKDTVAHILREKSVRLSRAYHRVGRQMIQVDYVPTIRLRGFWIIEAKPGNPKQMTFGDFLQAHLYAIHPEVNAQLIVLTNGWSVRVYDALTADSWERPVLICTRDDCRETLSDLRDLLGARSLLRQQRQRLLQHIEDTFRVEVDQDELQSFATAALRLYNEVRPVVTANARQVQIEALGEEQQKEQKALENERLETLIDVYIDIPTNGRTTPADVLARRITTADDRARTTAIETLVGKCYGRCHNICRVMSVYILLRLIDAGVLVASSRISELGEEVQDLVRRNAAYWEGDETQWCPMPPR